MTNYLDKLLSLKVSQTILHACIGCSQGGSITWRTTQNPTGHDYGHHMSKAAANMMSVLLSQELKSKGAKTSHYLQHHLANSFDQHTISSTLSCYHSLTHSLSHTLSFYHSHSHSPSPSTTHPPSTSTTHPPSHSTAHPPSPSTLNLTHPPSPSTTLLPFRSLGISVVKLHPGFNKTDMTKKYAHIWEIEGAVDPEIGT